MFPVLPVVLMMLVLKAALLRSPNIVHLDLMHTVQLEEPFPPPLLPNSMVGQPFHTIRPADCSGQLAYSESVPSTPNGGCTSITCNSFAGSPSVESCQQGAYIPPTGLNVVVGLGQNSTCGGISLYYTTAPTTTCTPTPFGQYGVATCSGGVVTGKYCSDSGCSVSCTNITNGCDSTTYTRSYCTTTPTSAPTNGPTSAPTHSPSAASTVAFSFILNGILILITFALFNGVI